MGKVLTGPILINGWPNVISLDFSRGLRDLAWLWFAKFPREMKNDGYLDMEEYILSKGMYAREACMKLLPLMGRLEIWKIKEERKARVLAVLHWLFPRGSI